eukprot:scaffold307781_cov30-Tisochrysis_lutea.AAC.4
MLAGAIESTVSNRAEAQRFYGIQKFAKIEATLNTNVVARGLGPGFCANASRNFIMASSSFVVTPLLYQRYYPQEKKDARSLFWFGLGINIFAGGWGGAQGGGHRVTSNSGNPRAKRAWLSRHDARGPRLVLSTP